MTRLAAATGCGRIRAMASSTGRSVGYTETEVRSYLPSGWGIVAGATGRRDAASRTWSIDVYDGADNTWKLEVAGDAASAEGRLAALQTAVRRLERKALGRKSVLFG